MLIEKNRKGHSYLTGQRQLDPAKSTLLFIHGSGSHAGFWEYQLQGFEGIANTVALDLPGHGRSREKCLDSIWAYATALESFIGDANIPNPVPCGLSMGGAVVLTLLLGAGQRYPAGILINSGARLKVAPMVFDLLKTDYKAYVNLFKSIAASEKSCPSFRDKVAEDLEKTNPSVLLNDFKACDTFDVMDRLEKIIVPVMVLTAEDDQLTPPKYGRFMADTIPGASHIQVGNAGHISPVEQPESVNSAIQNFVAQQLGSSGLEKKK